MRFIKHRGTFPVEVKTPDGETCTLETQLSSTLPTTPAALAGSGLIVAWSGVVDDQGQPVPFSSENLSIALDDVPTFGAVFRALVELREQAFSGELITKNSVTPPSGGSPGPVPAPPA